MARNTSKSRLMEVEENQEEVSESYISIGLGLLVVVVVGILLYNYFTQKNANKGDAEKQAAEKIAQESTMSAQPGTTYTVVAGDTLWSISEKSYGTGFNWNKIAEANNLKDNDQLEKGQQLTIPVVASNAPVASPTEASPVASPIAEEVAKEASPSPSSQPSPVPSVAPVATITGSTYTVVSGDTLWDIACRSYGDCYAWVRIAQANKLVNPNLIHPGNEFTLPR